MNIRILSPTGVVFEGEISHATFPGELGSFNVYPRHAPMISALKNGVITFWQNNTPEDQPNTVPIESGFVEINSDNLTVCIEKI
ncbi:MAG: F0F1 ATP synthase subunit epsilon [Tannerella sp.]|jgi:F-type H+-transporting ATPase subunit epsilon|nr:F0F1 ATP synthase subunit epsilon [Tannerella sp.]